jgi:hypothetical protein
VPHRSLIGLFVHLEHCRNCESVGAPEVVGIIRRSSAMTEDGYEATARTLLIVDQSVPAREHLRRADLLLHLMSVAAARSRQLRQVAEGMEVPAHVPKPLRSSTASAAG